MPTTLRFDCFEVDLAAGQLFKRGARIHLREQSFQVLAMLLERPGQVVTREELRRRLWPDDVFVDFDNNLNTAVARLREVLNDSPERPRFIETLPKRGYRFIGAVTDSVPAPGPVAAPMTLPGSVLAASVPVARKSGRARLAAASVVIALIAVIAGWNLGVYRRPRGPADAAPIRSIAVLPLENLSGDPSQDYFVDGMSDAITTELGKIGRFERVISWQSMKGYKGTTKTAEEIAKEVDVDALVRGVVTREGTRVRISARLIRVRPERQVWANSYDRELREILSLHTEVAQAISAEVKVTLERAKALSTPGEVNADAYDFYLRGKQYLEDRLQETALRASVQMFERAVAIDPALAGAHAGLSRAHVGLWFNYYDRSEQRRRAAHSEAARAVQLQPDSAETHAARGWVLYEADLDYAGALEEFAIAQRINPNDSDIADGIAMIARRQGRVREAIGLAEQAALLSPNDARICFNLAVTYALARRYSDAERRFERAVSLRPNGQFYARRARFALLAGKADLARAILLEARQKAATYSLIPYYCYQLELSARDYRAALAWLSSDSTEAFEWQWFYVPKALLRAQVFALTGEPDSARREYDAARVLLEARLRAQADDDRFLGTLGIAYAGLGRRKEALETGKKGMDLMPMSKEAWRATYRVEDMARIFMMVGEHEEAIKKLDFLLSVPAEVSIAGLLSDPTWAPLQTSAGFQALVGKYRQ
jgi:TolB-like protein/DNA-binding winged helix-turn-helix (wHTH) protein